MVEVRAARVVTPQGIISPGAVEIGGGRIVAVSAVTGDVPDRTLCPGFVDLQVNGHGDVDVATATGDEWHRLDESLLSQGVTTWCPTLTSRPLDLYPPALAAVEEVAGRPGPRPTIAGVHLEGPFLSPDHAGAHPAGHLGAVDRGWLDALPPMVKVVTIAPELKGALGAIASLSRRGVLVALGHSGADHATTTAAVDAGARLVTHVFNAMATLHQREPGLVGAALTDDRVAVSLIADLVHAHPAVLSLVFRAKGPFGVALITDATAWQSPRIREAVTLRDGAPRRSDGTLAGSTLTMDRALANVVRHAGVPLEGGAAAAATVPARLLGLTDRGRIEPGARADLVALRPDLSIEAVWVGGEQVVGG